jgi:hypothetical protein
MPVLKYGEDAPVGVPGSAMGIGLVGGVGAVLLDVLHGGGASVVISLIAASTLVIVAGLATLTVLSRTVAVAMAAVRTTTEQLHGSPFFLDLPQDWNQRSLLAALRNDPGSGVCKVLAFRPMLSGGTKALLERPNGPTWHKLDELASLTIEISSKEDQRKQLNE